MNKNAKKTNKNEKQQQKPLWKRALKGFGIFYGSVIAFIAILSILAMIFSPMLASAMELEEEYYCEYCGDVFSSQKKWEKHIIKCDVMLPPVEETTVAETTTVPEETTTETTVVETPEETTVVESTTVPETTTIVETTTEETTVAETTTVPEEPATEIVSEETTVAETTTVPEETTVIPVETTTVVENTTEKTAVPEKTTRETTTKPVETTTEPVVEVTTSKPAVDEVATQPNINLPEINWEGIAEFFNPDNEEVEELPENIVLGNKEPDQAVDETTTVPEKPATEIVSEEIVLGHKDSDNESAFPETGNPAPIAAFLLLGIAAVGIVASKKKSNKENVNA